MKWYVKLLFAFGFFSSVNLLLGEGSRWSLAGFVICTSSLLLLLSIRLREGSFEEQEKLLRRIGVFMLGGFICPKCGEGKVKLGIGYMPCISCPGCRKFFLVSTTPMTVGAMWRSVWRRRR